ncbi:MAG: MBL fold metallo-hydrolase [Sphingobacteriaceae bacterium]|nr:MBL fold metallo-hydrolase [Sphingobacteriaceae bacterium]
MKLTFLGTGTSQGIPLIGCNCDVCTSADLKDKRLRTSVLIESNNTRVVIDTGPDFRTQMLREKINKLDAVIFTHEHKDHIAGLDDVRAFNYINKKKIPVYASERVQTALKREYAYIFSDEKYPGIPEIEINTISDIPFTIGNLFIEPINVLHYKLPVKGFKVNNLAFITDANFISEGEKKKLMNLDVLILNALRREAHVSHFTFQEAQELVKELKPNKAYFVHMSHQLGKHAHVDNELPENIELAFDGLQIIV